MFELGGATKVDGCKTAGMHTRRCLLEATASALAAGGVHAVSVRAICAEAGGNGPRSNRWFTRTMTGEAGRIRQQRREPLHPAVEVTLLTSTPRSASNSSTSR